MATWSDHAEALARVRLVALDVDGVLTDGRIVYVGDAEAQAFDVHDGQGLAWLRRAGVEVAWITGRGSAATRARAQGLGVVELHVRVPDKHAVLVDVQRRLGITRAETLAMGDDVPDLGLARAASLFVAPANARSEVRERADVVCAAAGGRGAVREACEALLRARGAWDELLHEPRPGG
jgi:3-deoxy-D-manno-octulosonate 8-phosphate phosphatase (KDO 8-P phosphatase)